MDGDARSRIGIFLRIFSSFRIYGMNTANPGRILAFHNS